MDGCSLLPCLHRASSFGICSLTTLRLESVKGMRLLAACQRLEKSLPTTSRGHPFRGFSRSPPYPRWGRRILVFRDAAVPRYHRWQKGSLFCSWLASNLICVCVLASQGALTAQGRDYIRAYVKAFLCLLRAFSRGVHAFPPPLDALFRAANSIGGDLAHEILVSLDACSTYLPLPLGRALAFRSAYPLCSPKSWQGI